MLRSFPKSSKGFKLVGRLHSDFAACKVDLCIDCLWKVQKIRPGQTAESGTPITGRVQVALIVVRNAIVEQCQHALLNFGRANHLRLLGSAARSLGRLGGTLQEVLTPWYLT